MKNHIRALLPILLAVLLLLAACDTEKNKTPETAQPLPETSTEAEIAHTTPQTDAPVTTEASAAQTEAVDSKPTGAQPTAVSAPELEPDITHGTVEGAVYRNSFLGIVYTLPEGQKYLTEQQIAASNGIRATEISDRSMYQTLMENAYFIDMQTYDAQSPEFYVNLAYQDLNTFQPVEDAADYFEKSKESTLLMFANFGFQNTSFEVESYALDGEECAGAVICAWYGDQLIYQRMVGVIKDHYVAMINACGSDAEKADSLLDGFAWIR